MAQEDPRGDPSDETFGYPSAQMQQLLDEQEEESAEAEELVPRSDGPGCVFIVSPHLHDCRLEVYGSIRFLGMIHAVSLKVLPGLDGGFFFNMVDAIVWNDVTIASFNTSIELTGIDMAGLAEASVDLVEGNPQEFLTTALASIKDPSFMVHLGVEIGDVAGALAPYLFDVIEELVKPLLDAFHACEEALDHAIQGVEDAKEKVRVAQEALKAVQDEVDSEIQSAKNEVDRLKSVEQNYKNEGNHQKGICTEKCFLK
eukprot:gene696-1154_t